MKNGDVNNNSTVEAGVAGINIVTICRDNPEALAPTLKSVALQVHRPARHIVVDGSNSAIQPKIARLARTHGAEYVWSQPEGIYAAMAHGLNMLGHQDYVWFLNATDTLATRYSLAEVDRALKEKPVTSSPEWLVGRTLVQTSGTWHTLRFPRSPRDFVDELAQGKLGLPHSSSIARVGALRAVAAFEPGCSIAEDYRTGLALATRHGLPIMTPQLLSIYDQTGASAQQSIKTSVEKSIARLHFQQPGSLLFEPFRILRGPIRAIMRRAWGFTKSVAIQRMLGWDIPPVPAQSEHFCGGGNSGDWPGCCLVALGVN